MLKRVSFDFDGTLDRANVYSMAQYLIDKGIEVWIVTSRCTEKEYRKINLYYNNHDLYEVAVKLNIPDERIVFTNLTSKSKFFYSCGKEFIAHIDDDMYELLDILDLKMNIKPINVDYEGWDKEILSLI